MAGRRFGIELSPDRVEVWVRGDGLVVQEPAVAVRDRATGRIPVTGAQALRVAVGPDSGADRVFPIGTFELRDQEAAEQMLRQLITRVVGRLVFVRHELALAVPAELSTASRRALLEVALASGARMAHLLDLPLALAFGAGLPVTAWDPLPVLFLLPDSAQAAIVCHHGLLASRSLDLFPAKEEPWSSPERAEALVGMVRELLEEVPAAGLGRIRASGFAVAGRVAGLEQAAGVLARRSTVPARVVADPEHCVVKGAEVALERIEATGGRSLLYLR
ncbi:MAG: rod shape-determining protein [Candidatus Dormibacteria bacterium]